MLFSPLKTTHHLLLPHHNPLLTSLIYSPFITFTSL
jgi:hypothetical protein